MENRQNGDNMTSMRSIARKRLLFNKTESFFIIFIISVMVGALLVSFSLSKNYFDFFIAEAEALTGNSLSKVLDNSVSNLSEIGEYIVDFTMYFVGYQVPEKIEEHCGYGKCYGLCHFNVRWRHYRIGLCGRLM